MRIRVCHETLYRYETPPTGVIQTLRVTPRSHDGQYVAAWRTEVSANCRVGEQEDAFGNIVQTFCADGPIDELRVLVDGEVDTEDTNGVVRDVVERFPPSFFLRATPLTLADEPLAALAAKVAGADALTSLHGLLDTLHEQVEWKADAFSEAAASGDTLTQRHGNAGDLAHLFVAAARALRIPSRYVSGYFHCADDIGANAIPHAWAEGYVPGLGWVGFDAATGACPTDRHVRVAIGVDALSAAPARCARYGGGAETVRQMWDSGQAASQTQS